MKYRPSTGAGPYCEYMVARTIYTCLTYDEVKTDKEGLVWDFHEQQSVQKGYCHLSSTQNS